MEIGEAELGELIRKGMIANIVQRMISLPRMEESSS